MINISTLTNVALMLFVTLLLVFVLAFLLKHFKNEMLCDIGDRDMIGKRVVAHFDFAIGCLDITRFKRRSSYYASICYHSKTPNINFVGMTNITVVYISQ